MEALKAQMSNELFHRLSDFIYTECGIKLPQSKKVMLEIRLQKRLQAIGLGSFDAYCNYLFSPEGIANEMVQMIDVVTTNKTDFFREPAHFEYLIEHALPTLLSSKGAGVRRPLMIWSAACSSGEEPYTLAMLMNEFSERFDHYRFNILATDISTRVLDQARLAIYDDDRVEDVPRVLSQRYLMVSKKGDGKVRVVPELRRQVHFRRLNFLDHDFGFREKMDIIFCRNVLIYFDRTTQERVVQHLCQHLHSGGYLFTGHSEILHDMDLPLKAVANSISRRL